LEAVNGFYWLCLRVVAAVAADVAAVLRVDVACCRGAAAICACRGGF